MWVDWSFCYSWTLDSSSIWLPFITYKMTHLQQAAPRVSLSTRRTNVSNTDYRPESYRCSVCSVVLGTRLSLQNYLLPVSGVYIYIYFQLIIDFDFISIQYFILCWAKHVTKPAPENETALVSAFLASIVNRWRSCRTHCPYITWHCFIKLGSKEINECSHIIYTSSTSAVDRSQWHT